ncbi:SpoIIE family protein phosphatase [Beggiatoa leptomitoformis]|uniref:SpoIIE family protein phosphatase n=1 Tax=Beggiatoa leptomitoformis TaxID=288004 RepID=A0A2N9YET2_9GAMM|nr:SpoIIE family protein phosphatase [Beggiatoa leptomitoformis]ALG68655.1 SpoIIE family protein phosphatase [Beggiatoa leptomitoformis]AUI68993.1 SpoIIE family protein phosphatase [Beggiatoa leptomitoformis]
MTQFIPRWFIRWANLVPLRYVFIIPFIILLLLTVSIIGGLSWYTGQTAVNTLAYQLRQSVSIRIQDHLNHYLETPYKVNRTVQDALNLNWLDAQQVTSLQAFFFKQTQLFDEMSYIQLGNINGEFIGVERRTDGVLSVDIADQTTHGDMESYLLNAQGLHDKKPLSFVPAYDPRQQIWYKAAEQTQQDHWTIQVGKSNWSEIFSFFGQTWLSITHSTPLFKEGKLIGVVATDFTLTDLSRFLHDLKISANGQTFIMQRSGELLATSTQEQLYTLEAANKKIQRLSALSSQTPLIRQTAEFIQKQFHDFQTIQEAKQTEYLLADERQFVQILPFRDAVGLDWLIVVVVPETDFMGQINANTRTTIELASIALCIALVLGFIISYWVIRPISYLNRAAQHLANGTWTQLPIERRDELGELTNSFNFMATQLKETFDNLEEKVAFRTAQIVKQANELAQANQHIKLLNEQLRVDNVRMSTELSITKRLQQMVLPRAEELAEIECLDIASFMEPATEVGGDYYDILQENGRIKIGIGDVTGHGLESGVLMMMVQTAVRTLLSSHIDNPKDFLSILNRTLYGNLQRMQSDKNLTLSLIDYHNGRLHLSGQHEEVLYVDKTGKIERIDTISLGFMVGLEPDITDFIMHREVHLAEGDGIVLYTDGITEAMNEKRQQYGIQRLCDIVSQHWSLNATEIQQAVIIDLRRHIGTCKLQDDVTLLVIKQKELTAQNTQLTDYFNIDALKSA